MKKLYKLLLLLIFLTLNFQSVSHAQSILAGETGTGITFVDIVPDTVLNPDYHYTKSYSIDLNNDGIDDFLMSATYSGGLGGGGQSASITPLNNNEVAISATDSCFDFSSVLINTYDLTKAFNFNSAISFSEQWKDSTSYLHYNFWIMGSYNCSGGLFDLAAKYIGVKVFANPDTLYGWIKVSQVAYHDVTIEEYAYKKATGGIQNIDNSYISRVYPNPFSQTLNIDINPANTAFIELSIYDILGKQWIDLELQNGKNVIDTKILNRGMYFYQIKWEGKYIAGGKIVAM
ncbi:MAG: T9SS type A sorting domain-containing protein [Bacteroidota bacterium]